MKKKTRANLDELAHGEYLDYLEDVRRRENKSNISEEAKKLLEKKHANHSGITKRSL